MAQFIFSLQAVLDHRRRIEEETQKAVAAVQIRLDECQGAIARLEECQRRHSAEMYQRLAKGMPERERALYSNYLEAVGLELERLAVLEARIQAELEVARKRLVKAMRDRELIEEIRKAEYQEYVRAEELEERKLYDDLAQRAWRLGQAENLAARMED
jgi:flagellar FliJ protein